MKKIGALLLAAVMVFALCVTTNAFYSAGRLFYGIKSAGTDFVGNTAETEVGDCNFDGIINNKDVVTLFRTVSGSYIHEHKAVYDFNGDGEPDNKDVVALFRFVSTVRSENSENTGTENDLNIIIDSLEAKAGEDVEVMIELKGITALSSFKITLTYDEKLSVAKKGNGKDKVDFSGMAVQYPDDATVMSAANNYPDDHVLIINWQALDDEITADSAFITITFITAEDTEAKEFLPVTAEINADDIFRYDHGNNDEIVNVDFYLINGGVEITDETNGYGWLTFTDNGDHYEVSKCDESASGEIIIPSSVTIGGRTLPVTSIGEEAFSGCISITSVTIPDGVTSIGRSAFALCSGLISVTIPDSVAHIGWYAFSKCSSLTSIKIPDGVSFIGWCTFEYCENLTSVTIPNSVTSIDYNAFSGCSGLESITVSDKNEVFHSDGNCLIETESKTLIAGCKNSVIPDDGSVTSIGMSAFESCTSLISMTIPDGVTSIGARVFCGCSSLTSVSIPKSVTSIDDSAFDNCCDLTTVYYSGSEKQWNEISIESDNDPLLNANIVCSVTSVEAEPGDVNGDNTVDNKDVVILFRAVSAEVDEYNAVYDFNGDGEVNNKDVVALFREVSKA